MSISTQILYFDNLAALEAHLQSLLDSCKDSAEEYREMLGDLLRQKQGQEQKEEEKWSQEISSVLSGSGGGESTQAGEKSKVKKDKGSMFGGKSGGSIKSKNETGDLMFGEKPKKEKGKLFGGKGGKSKIPTDWVPFEPFAVFVGEESKGKAELYFEAINRLDETSKKIELALSALGTIKGRTASTGNVSATVSFINGIPARIMLRRAFEGQKKKKMLEFRFKLPVARPAIPQGQ